MEERVEGRRRRVILVLEEEREGWVVKLWRTWVPNSPAPRTRIEVGGGAIFGVVVVEWYGSLWSEGVDYFGTLGPLIQ